MSDGAQLLPGRRKRLQDVCQVVGTAVVNDQYFVVVFIILADVLTD